jgi:hypothetical protein
LSAKSVRGRVRSTGRFVNDVEQENSSLLVVLKLFKSIAFLGSGARDLKMGYASEVKSLGDFLHQVVKLDEKENPFF